MTYDTKDEAKNAVEMFNGTDFNGQKVGVEFSKRKNARDKTPGKYLGRSRRRRSLTLLTLGQATAGLVDAMATGTTEGEIVTETTVVAQEIAAGTEEIVQEIVVTAIETTEDTAETVAETEEKDLETEEAAQMSDIDAEIVLNNL